MSIGTRIIQIRNEKGFTQRQLSKSSGIASSYLSRIENRRLEPRPKTLQKIAEALQVPLSELFEERPASKAASRCVITASGNCIMELLTSGRRRRQVRPGSESYSLRQLQLLRMANYLIQSGNNRLLDTLGTLFGALLATEGKRHGPRPPLTPAAPRRGLPSS